MEEPKVFTRILGVAENALLGVVGAALGVAIGAFLGIAGTASGNGDKPTKFTIRVENTTKPDSFTAYKKSRMGNRIPRLRVLCASPSRQHSSRRNIAGRAASIGMAARPDFSPLDHQLNIFSMCPRHRG